VAGGTTAATASAISVAGKAGPCANATSRTASATYRAEPPAARQRSRAACMAWSVASATQAGGSCGAGMGGACRTTQNESRTQLSSGRGISMPRLEHGRIGPTCRSPHTLGKGLMMEFIIIVAVISIVTGIWVPASRQPFLDRAYDSAEACDAAAHAMQPLPGTRLVCLPRDAPDAFTPPQARPPFGLP
jgi:hypothetical protein